MALTDMKGWRVGQAVGSTAFPEPTTTELRGTEEWPLSPRFSDEIATEHSRGTANVRSPMRHTTTSSPVAACPGEVVIGQAYMRRMLA